MEELDVWLRDNRDFSRFENREIQACTIGTMFGSVTIKRRRYIDPKTIATLLQKEQEYYGFDEAMICSIPHSQEKRLNVIRLLAMELF